MTYDEIYARIEMARQQLYAIPLEVDPVLDALLNTAYIALHKALEHVEPRIELEEAT